MVTSMGTRKELKDSAKRRKIYEAERTNKEKNAFQVNVPQNKTATAYIHLGIHLVQKL